MSILLETIAALDAMLPDEALVDAHTGDRPPADVSNTSRRFLRAQLEHAGFDYEEVEGLLSRRAHTLAEILSRMEWEDAVNQLFSVMMMVTIESGLAAQGLAPAEVAWGEEEDLDTSVYSGGYVHGSTGETVRVAGRAEDGSIVVHFNADQPHQHEERWCESHFGERFVAVDDIPLLGGDS